MCLENHRSDTNDFSTLASGVVWRAHLITSAMGKRQGVCLWQGTLPRGLPGPIHVDHDPLRTRSVRQATERGKWFAGKHLLVKAGAQGFHRALIERGERRIRV